MTLPTDGEMALWRQDGHNARTLAVMAMVRRLGINAGLARQILHKAAAPPECLECSGRGFIRTHVVEEPDGTKGWDGDNCEACGGTGEERTDEAS